MQSTSKGTKSGTNLNWKVIFPKRHNLTKCVALKELESEIVQGLISQTNSEDFRLYARPKFKNILKNCSDKITDALEVQSIFAKLDLEISNFVHLDSENAHRIISIIQDAKKLADTKKLADAKKLNK